jgi:hypothetical protein
MPPNRGSNQGVDSVLTCEDTEAKSALIQIARYLQSRPIILARFRAGTSDNLPRPQKLVRPQESSISRPFASGL